MTKNAARTLLIALALSLVAASCGGGPGTLEGEADRLRGQSADDVQPPEPVDPQRLAQAGMILSTNSQSLREITDAPGGRGAVVLFVLPNGPSDRRGIAQGDLLTAVDGTAVWNHEHAVALLRSQEGETRELMFNRRGGGRERSVDVQAAIPTRGARGFLNEMIESNPNSPLLRYIRAQAEGGSLEDRLSDLEVAIREAPRFVEAITLQASLVWDRRGGAENDEQRVEFANAAVAGWDNALDIEPRHGTTLAVRSTAYTELGEPGLGKADAERALSIDGTHPRAHWALARAEIGLDDLEAATGPARAAVELNPYNDLTYYRTLASIFMEQEREEDCVSTVEAITPFLEAHDNEAYTQAAESLADVCA